MDTIIFFIQLIGHILGWIYRNFNIEIPNVFWYWFLAVFFIGLCIDWADVVRTGRKNSGNFERYNSIIAWGAKDVFYTGCFSVLLFMCAGLAIGAFTLRFVDGLIFMFTGGLVALVITIWGIKGERSF